jgi:HEAT repeat protein
MSGPDLEQLATGTLVDRALAEQARHRATGEEADQEDVAALAHLQEGGTREVFDAAVALLDSDNPQRRTLGARILREHGGSHGGQAYAAEAAAILRGCVAAESDPEVLTQLITALSQHADAADLETVIRFSTHEDDSVREAAACGLLDGVDPRGRLRDIDRRIVDALVRLSADAADDVRYSAVYDIANRLDLDADGRLADALLAHIDDPDDDLRALARAGCARTRPTWARLVAARPELATAELVLVDADDGRPQLRLMVLAAHAGGSSTSTVAAWSDHWEYSRIVEVDLERLSAFAGACALIASGGDEPAEYADSSLSILVDRDGHGDPRVAVMLGDDGYASEALRLVHRLGRDRLAALAQQCLDATAQPSAG